MIDDKEIGLELNKMMNGTAICSLLPIYKYIEYAEKHDLVFRHFPLLDCGFIIFNGKTIILRTEEKGTKFSIQEYRS